MSWVSIRRPRQQVSKGGSVKEYVSCMSMPENGLDCQSRRSKTCVVNNGTFSTEVLRVSIGYRSTRSKLFPLFGFRSKRWPNNGADGRVQGRGCAHFSQQRDHGRAELSFRLCISTGEWALSAVHIAGKNFVSGRVEIKTRSRHPTAGTP